MRTIDLNADVGESAGDDASLIPLITSANVACGGHAGDPQTMRETMVLAVRHGVAIGAHPGYVDREHFGRRPMTLDEPQVVELILDQVGALDAIAAAVGAALVHVKAHGALYNQAEVDDRLARALVKAVLRYPRRLALVGRAGSAMEHAARAAGLPFRAEAFADRRYRADGALVSRSEPGSVLEDPNAVAAQVRRLVRDGEVETNDGSRIPVAFETLCLHGDTPGAARLARQVRQVLADLGVAVAPIGPVR
ncbi:MAG TPA: 5-oxoprolinase subunit PxpA [Candidatus Limnocylindria bacterium]|nr:5-oxoprolinase subunit PxpA [Candidatus Limnocylindria bacterium]